jgi:hypothetical protein
MYGAIVAGAIESTWKVIVAIAITAFVAGGTLVWFLMWAMPHLWHWLRPIIHSWTA